MVMMISEGGDTIEGDVRHMMMILNFAHSL